MHKSLLFIALSGFVGLLTSPASANTVSQSVALSSGSYPITYTAYYRTMHEYKDVLWSKLCSDRYVDTQICGSPTVPQVIVHTPPQELIIQSPPAPPLPPPPKSEIGTPVKVKF